MAKQPKITLLIDLADKITGKLGKLEGKVTRWQGKMQNKLNSFSDKISSKLGVSTENLTRSLKVGAVAGIGALSLLGTKSIQAAEKFDSAFLPIQQLNLDKPKAELEGYKSQIRNTAFEIGTGISESTNAMYDLQSATGLYGRDAIEVFKKVGKYSVATGANLGDAMNSTTKAMKAFGLEIKDIDKLLESNAKTVQTGITTFDELAKVQTTFGGSASTAGQDIDAANKMFAMFTSIAPDSNQAATMTKGFFDGLKQNASKLEKELKINVFDAKGNMRQADAIMRDISNSFKGMNDKEIAAVISQIGGPEGLQNALGKAAKSADDMIKTFDAFDSSKFSLSDALENAQGDFATMKKMFSNRLEIVFSQIGEKLLPMIAKVFDKLTPVLNWLYKNMDWLVPAFASFVGVLGTATAAVWLFNTAVSANPISLLIIAIAGVIALITTAIAKFDEWGSVILTIMGPIGLITKGIIMIRRHWESITEAFQSEGIIAGLKRLGIVLLDTIMHPLQRILGWMAELTDAEWAKEAAGSVEEFRRKMELITPEEEEAKKRKTEKENNDLYGSENNFLETITKNKNNGVGNVVQRVTGASTSAKNIKINIDALHKGDNNLTGEGGRKLTMKEYEAMFEEMMLRILRNAEMS